MSFYRTKYIGPKNQTLLATPEVGFSNGWLNFKLSKSFVTQSKIFQGVGAATCEIVCDDDIGIKMINTISHLESKSIHLPKFTKFDEASKTKLNLIGKSLEQVFSFHGASRATIHADVVTSEILTWLKHWNIPVAIENMDRSRKSGKLPFEIIRYCNEFKVPLVLDLQHAYEVSLDLYGPGREQEIAIQLAKLAKKSHGISQIHLSGEISNGREVKHNHSLLAFSTNRRQIFDTLLSVRNILGGKLPPIIFEGDYLPLLSPGEKDGQSRESHSKEAMLNMTIEKNLFLDEMGYPMRSIGEDEEKASHLF